MSNLRVGDVCKEPLALKAGMRARSLRTGCSFTLVEIEPGNESWLLTDVDDPSRFPRAAFENIRRHGVTILALPEEAPLFTLPKASDGKPFTFASATPEHIAATTPVITQPAAPSLDVVPVGSRWRISSAMDNVIVLADGKCRWESEGTISEVVDRDYLLLPGKATRIDEPHPRMISPTLGQCTRIDELAGAGAARCGVVGERAASRCFLLPGHDGRHMFEWVDPATAPKPAMPPGKCAPGCTPAKSCRITIPVTDKGARYECPALKED